MVRGGEFYLQGQQIGIAPRSLLLEHGPYRNTFCEDRDMWRRFAGLGIYMGLKHKVFRDRMKLTRKKRVYKAVFIKTFHHLLYDLRQDRFPLLYSLRTLMNILPMVKTPRSKRLDLLRAVVLAPSYLISLVTPKLKYSEAVKTHAQYAKLLEENSYTCSEIFTALGLSENSVNFSGPEARKIFMSGERKT